MVNLSTAARNAACQAVTNLVSTGGKLRLMTASNATVAVFTWSSAVFGSPTNGEATANSTSPVEASADGTVTQWKLQTTADVDVMWGVVGQRYRIVQYDATNGLIRVGGNRVSEFAARTVVTLVYRPDQSQNIVVRVDNQTPTFDGTNTTIYIFEALPSSPVYTHVHRGLLGLDNVEVKEGQQISLSSFRYAVLG